MSLPNSKSLPNGINKIIEEYCYYPRKFHDELLDVTINILLDTENYWSYGDYFVYIDSRTFSCDMVLCSYTNDNGEWRARSIVF